MRVDRTWPPLPDKPPAARAYAPVPVGSTAKRRRVAAKSGAVPQSTAKDLQSNPASTAKAQATGRAFAVLDDLEDAGPFDDFAGLDRKEWRIERRYRRRKDGALIMYWNYRRRKIDKDGDGNRRIKYLKGGSKAI